MLTLLLFSYLSAISQNNFRVTGRVTDEQGMPLLGVTVSVKGTTNATSTKADGTFELNVPSGDAVLVLTSVGFAEQEVALGAGDLGLVGSLLGAHVVVSIALVR